MIATLLATQVGSTHYFEKCAVVSDHELSSQAGVEIMRQGGNAIDAAVATGLSLAVTFPAAGNIGGGGFMVIRTKDGKSLAIDYRETAPKGATRNMYLDASGKPTQDSSFGYRASGVPGTVAGFYEAHKRFGKLPWATVVAPAIRQAREGFTLNYQTANEFKRVATEGKQFAGTWRIFGRNGNFYNTGERFKQPELAETLERIAKQGREGFYRGKTAELMQQEMKVGGGLITSQDLADYQAIPRDALVGDFPLNGNLKGYRVITMPPPSSGGVILLMMLGMLDKDDLARSGFNSSETVHLMTETMKRCFADRSEYMGDPGYVDVPVEKLLNPMYLAMRRAEISLTKATPSAQIRPGLAPKHESEHTTHYSVVDSEGNAVANTYTLNTGYGSKVTLGSIGVLMNNEMDDFASLPGSTNGYGLIQGEANAIAAGKRPLSSMTPTILEKGGELFLVTGSPGGPTIINTVMEVILNTTVHGMDIQRAVSAPRFHHQWFPDQIRYEPWGFSADTIEKLKSIGQFPMSAGSSQGSAHSIKISQGGTRGIGLDPRVSTSGSAGY